MKPVPLKPGELRISLFLVSQWQDLRNKGLKGLLSKLSKLVKLLAALPAALLIRLLRPVVTIRLIQLRFERIGHMAAEPEIFLSKKDLGMVEPSDLEIFYPFRFYRAPVANRQLYSMWLRTLRVIPAARWVDLANRLIPGGARHSYDFGQPREWDLQGAFARTRPHLSFTREETLKGFEMLRTIGVPAARPFVCFIARDPSYLTSHQPTEGDYNRRWNFRDSDIETYMPAIRALTERGYYALRMGAAVAKPLSMTHPMVIDYATQARSDFMDIFLIAQCAFYLGDTAGLFEVPSIFRRPIAWVNLVPLEHMPGWGPRDLVITKIFYARDKGRYLTFAEIFDLGLATAYHDERYEELGVEVHNNTPEEIAALAIEMDARLKGTWHPSEEDEDLQRRFWAIFNPRDSLGRVTTSRIGATFLRKYRELLE